MTNQDEPKPDNKNKILNTTIVTFAAQAGCSAVVVIGLFLMFIIHTNNQLS